MATQTEKILLSDHFDPHISGDTKTDALNLCWAQMSAQGGQATASDLISLLQDHNFETPHSDGKTKNWIATMARWAIQKYDPAKRHNQIAALTPDCPDAVKNGGYYDDSWRVKHIKPLKNYIGGMPVGHAKRRIAEDIISGTSYQFNRGDRWAVYTDQRLKRLIAAENLQIGINEARKFRRTMLNILTRDFRPSGPNQAERFAGPRGILTTVIDQMIPVYTSVYRGLNPVYRQDYTTVTIEKKIIDLSEKLKEKEKNERRIRTKKEQVMIKTLNDFILKQPSVDEKQRKRELRRARQVEKLKSICFKSYLDYLDNHEVL